MSTIQLLQLDIQGFQNVIKRQEQEIKALRTELQALRKPRKQLAKPQASRTSRMTPTPIQETPREWSDPNEWSKERVDEVIQGEEEFLDDYQGKPFYTGKPENKPWHLWDDGIYQLSHWPREIWAKASNLKELRDKLRRARVFVRCGRNINIIDALFELAQRRYGNGRLDFEAYQKKHWTEEELAKQEAYEKKQKEKEIRREQYRKKERTVKE